MRILGGKNKSPAPNRKSAHRRTSQAWCVDARARVSSFFSLPSSQVCACLCFVCLLQECCAVVSVRGSVSFGWLGKNEECFQKIKKQSTRQKFLSPNLGANKKGGANYQIIPSGGGVRESGERSAGGEGHLLSREKKTIYMHFINRLTDARRQAWPPHAPFAVQRA